MFCHYNRVCWGKNPVIDSNIPDPGVLALHDGSGYVVVSTSNYTEIGVGMTISFIDIR